MAKIKVNSTEVESLLPLIESVKPGERPEYSEGNMKIDVYELYSCAGSPPRDITILPTFDKALSHLTAYLESTCGFSIQSPEPYIQSPDARSTMANRLQVFSPAPLASGLSAAGSDGHAFIARQLLGTDILHEVHRAEWERYVHRLYDRKREYLAMRTSNPLIVAGEAAYFFRDLDPVMQVIRASVIDLSHTLSRYAAATRELEHLRPMIAAWNHGAGYLIGVSDIVVVIPRPALYTIQRPNPPRMRGWPSTPTTILHRDDGPAIEWQDGTGRYFVRGVEVPMQVIMNIKAYTAQEIITESNIEVRRVMIDRFGLEDLMRELNPRARDHDPRFGTLLEIAVPRDEPIVVVKVKNSTPEPDGSFKDYYLRVPPQTRTARQGIAWTFNLPSDYYDPKQET